MYGPRYQWIHWNRRHGIEAALVDDQSFQEVDGCTIWQTREASEGMIFFGQQPFANTTKYFTKGISGYVSIHSIQALLQKISWGVSAIVVNIYPEDGSLSC